MIIMRNELFLFSKFTIQNVPIKFLFICLYNLFKRYLQYKMFLLNIVNLEKICGIFGIYNTKCSY